MRNIQHLARAPQHGDPTAALGRHRIKGRQQRRQRIARPHRPVDQIARRRALHAFHHETVVRHAAAPQHRRDQVARIARQPPVQPVPAAPGARIRPHVRARRKGRIGPRVPAPGVRPLQHPAAINRRHRIVRRRRIVRQHRLQRRPLHRVVARAAGVRRQSAFRALGVLEQIGRIAAPVHRRAAELRQPHRLHPRNPGGRRRPAHPARSIMVRVGPPALQVLGPEQPVLAVRRVADRRADLRRALSIAAVEPVEILPARDVRRQIRRIGGAVVSQPVHSAVAHAPVAQRWIPVDRHMIDVRIGPQRIEMEDHVSRPRLMPEILGPVRRIGQLHVRPDHRSALGRQRAVLRHRRIAARLIPRPRQPAHLRADQQAVGAFLPHDPGIVQRHAPQAPPVRLAEQAGDLRRRPYPVLAPKTSAPGMRRLPPAAIRIGQSIVRRHVHEDEGIQRHLQPTRLQFADGLPHAVV